MQYKIGWIGLATDKSCTRYSRKYALPIYMLHSCEMYTPESRHVRSKLSETVAGCADTATMCCLCQEREEKEETSQYVHLNCSFVIDC